LKSFVENNYKVSFNLRLERNILMKTILKALQQVIEIIKGMRLIRK
jgi:hypothetical protein